MKRYKVVVLLMLLSCQPKPEQTASEGLIEEEYRFYDFDFELTKYFSPLGVSEKFILKNYGANSSEAFKENNLYYIRYADQEKGQMLAKPDTVVSELNKAELDSLYAIASSYMKLKHSVNVAPYRIPPPPVADSEWERAEITLDLGFFGDKHSVSTERFSTLYQYLIKLKNKNH
ncbi:hypothetical protein [Pontibacter pamirensis]|uniref:hypothetical protein n=1 Tax=Pontibacter pamirensis TaxID=2562824 RepID=UPI0013899570|nr:hypothetical protein [Pontibacter pamirensis]